MSSACLSITSCQLSIMTLIRAQLATHHDPNTSREMAAHHGLDLHPDMIPTCYRSEDIHAPITDLNDRDASLSFKPVPYLRP